MRHGAPVPRHSSERTRALHGDATNLRWGSTNHRAAFLWLVLRYLGAIVALLFRLGLYCRHDPSRFTTHRDRRETDTINTTSGQLAAKRHKSSKENHSCLLCF